MLFLPGTLPTNRAALTALCAGLAAHSGVAARLAGAQVEPFSGTWGDAEREAGDAVKVASCFGLATPLHAVLGLTDLTPVDPDAVALTEVESRALCDAADAHLQVDDVRLTFVDAQTWQVTCAAPITVLTEPPEWLIGEPLRPNLPRGADARKVERWMNELQMLLFTHPVNAAREARGLPAINVVWLWGFDSQPAGLSPLLGREPAVLFPLPGEEGWGEGDGPQSKFGANATTLSPNPPAFAGAGSTPPRGAGEPNHLHAIRTANVPAWQAAWQSRSSEILSADSIILGDSRPRLRLTPRTPSTTSKITALFQRKPSLAIVLAQLQETL